MNFIELYKRYEFEIRAAEREIKELKESYEHYKDVDLLSQKIQNNITDQIIYFQRRGEEARKKLNDCIQQLSNIKDLERQIIMNQLKGKKLYDIADELGYSYGYIRVIHSKALKSLNSFVLSR